MSPSVEDLAAAFEAMIAPLPPEEPPPPPPPPAPAATAGAAGPAPAVDAPAPAAAEAAAAEAPAPPPSPVQVVDFARKGWHLDVTVSPGEVVEAARILDRAGFAIDAVTGVDWMAENQMEVVYDFFHPASPLRVVVRTRVPRDNPELPSIHEVFPGANWHERETHEFFGIRFAGHPDLSPLLLPEDATYHPLRKDFTGAA